MPSQSTGDGPTVSILCSNLYGGGAFACYTIARAIKHQFSVRLIGPTFGPPNSYALDSDDFPVISFSGSKFPRFFATCRKILKTARDDITIAYGVRFPSLGLGLVRKAISGTPCVLYVDEDDIALTMPGRNRPLRRRLAEPNGDIATRLTYRCIDRADATICGSDVFSRRFDGITVPLGRDSGMFDPAKYDSGRMRDRYNIGRDEIVIGFIGNPRPHVGFEDLLDAISQTHESAFTLLVAPANRLSSYAQEKFSTTDIRVRVLECEPSLMVPALLAAADVVVVPQRKEAVSMGQTPARLIDAMAMGKPIIATRTANIPDIVGTAGILVDERRPDAIRDALIWVKNNPGAAEMMGRDARARFLEQFSYESMSAKLTPILTGLLHRDARRVKR